MEPSYIFRTHTIVSIKLVSRREGSFFAIYINKSQPVFLVCLIIRSYTSLLFFPFLHCVRRGSIKIRATARKGARSVLPARLIVDYIGRSGKSGQAMLIQFVLLGKNGRRNGAHASNGN